MDERKAIQPIKLHPFIFWFKLKHFLITNWWRHFKMQHFPPRYKGVVRRKTPWYRRIKKKKIDP